MMRVVCDVNVLISGLLFGGIPGHVYDAGMAGKFMFLRSQELVDELRRVLHYPKFAERINQADLDIDGLLYDFVNASLPAPLVDVALNVLRDTKDIHILALAAGAKADFIVSGDKALLILNTYAGIPILTAEQFLTRLTGLTE